MILDKSIERYTSNAEYELKHGNLQDCLEFRQLAEWLKELKENKNVLDNIREEIGNKKNDRCFDDDDMYIYMTGLNDAIDIIDKYKAERSKK